MKILGLDTSLDRLKLAVTEDERMLAEQDWSAKGVLAEIIVDAMTNILKQAEAGLADLSGLAATVGPGSFTGLRVGLSVAKAIAWSKNLPLIAIPTFEVLAHQSPLKMTPVTVIALARENTVLAGIYDYVNDLPVLRGRFFTCQLIQLPHRIPSNSGVIVLGDSDNEQQVKIDLPESRILINHDITIPRGLSVARLGFRKLSQKESLNPKDVEPIYLYQAIYKSKLAHEWIPYPPHERD
jgi:tRNA threonylcarbamoyladenosine biosynthesis protein TsaB